MLKKTLYIIIVIFSIFFTFTFFVSNFLATEIKKEAKRRSNQVNLNDGSQIKFENLDPFISFSESGFKIKGLKYITKDSTIVFSSPFIIGINFWDLDVFLKYVGSSTYEIANKKFIMDMDSRLSCITDVDLRKFRVLLEYPISVVSSIKKINFAVNKLTVREAGKEFINQSANYTIKPVHEITYKSFKDLENKFPRDYMINGTLKSINKMPGNELPGFLSYLVPKLNFAGTFLIDYSNKNKISKTDKILSDAKIKFICKKCESSIADFDVLYEQNFKHELEKKINIDLNFKLNETFIDALPFVFLDKKLLNDIESIALDDNLIQLFKQKLKDIDYTIKYSLKHDATYKVSEELLNSQINNLVIKSSNGTGFGISGKIIIDNILSYNLTIEAFVFKAKNMIGFWSDFYHKSLAASPKNALFYDFERRLNTDFLKSISEHPNSTSDDLQFKIKHDSSSKNLLISGKTKEEVLNQYFLSKTKIISHDLPKQQSPEEYLNIIAPEALPYVKEIMNINKSGKKISEELWKKLTE